MPLRRFRRRRAGLKFPASRTFQWRRRLVNPTKRPSAVLVAWALSRHNHPATATAPAMTSKKEAISSGTGVIGHSLRKRSPQMVLSPPLIVARRHPNVHEAAGSDVRAVLLNLVSWSALRPPRVRTNHERV